MVPVGLVGQGGTDLDDRHALALVGDVGVRRHGLAVAGQLLEGDHCLAAERGGVEGELDVDRPLGGLGRERLGGRDGVAGGVGDRAGVLAVLAALMQLRGQRVLLAGDEVLIADRVGQLLAVLGQGLVVHVAVRLGGDPGHHDGLPLVGQVLVLGGVPAVLVEVEVLEAHEFAAAHLGRVDRDVDLDAAGGDAVGERLGRAADRALILAVLADEVDLGGQRVFAAGHVLELHGVGEGGLGVRRRVLGAVAGKRGRDADLAVLLGALVDVHAVAGDLDGEAHEVVPGVLRAGELDHVVGIVGECAQGVVHGDLMVGVAVEPHARGAVADELGLVGDRRLLGVERRVGRVGVLAVLREGGRSVDLAVLIGHDDVALAGGAARHEERDPRHLGLGETLDLVEVEVAADDLLLEVPVLGVALGPHDLAGLADLQGGLPRPVEQITLRRGLLGEFVGAVRQRRLGRLRAALGVGHEGLDDLAPLILLAVHEHAARRDVLDLDLGAGKRGRGLRHRLVALGVDLRDAHAATHDVLLEAGPAAVGDGLPVLTDLEGPGPGVVELIALRGLGFLDLVGAVGEVTEGPVAVPVGHGDLGVLAALLHPLAVDEDALGALVPERDLGALERRVALGDGLVARGVDLHAGNLAGHDVLRERGLAGELDRLAVLLDLEGLGPLLVQPVSLRGLGLLDLVGAVGEVTEGPVAVPVGHGDLGVLAALLHPLAVDEDALGALVPERDLGALERRVALGDGLVARGVDLHAGNLAGDDPLVHGREALLVGHLADAFVRPVALVDALGIVLADNLEHRRSGRGRVARGRLRLGDDGDAERQGGGPLLVTIEVVAGHLVFVGEFGVGAPRRRLDSLYDPRPRGRLAGEVGGALHASGVGGVEPDGELRALELGVALRLVAAGAVLLLNVDSERVVLRRLLALDRRGLARPDRHLMGVGAQPVSLRRRPLLHPVRARGELDGVGAAVLAGRERGHGRAGARAVAIDVVDGALQRVARVAVGERGVGRGLLELGLAGVLGHPHADRALRGVAVVRAVKDAVAGLRRLVGLDVLHDGAAVLRVLLEREAVVGRHVVEVPVGVAVGPQHALVVAPALAERPEARPRPLAHERDVGHVVLGPGVPLGLDPLAGVVPRPARGGADELVGGAGAALIGVAELDAEDLLALGAVLVDEVRVAVGDVAPVRAVRRQDPCVAGLVGVRLRCARRAEDAERGREQARQPRRERRPRAALPVRSPSDSHVSLPFPAHSRAETDTCRAFSRGRREAGRDVPEPPPGTRFVLQKAGKGLSAGPIWRTIWGKGYNLETP